MKKGIAVLYLSVGSGHQIAAEAIANHIKKIEPDMPLVIEDPFSNKIDILPAVFSALQAASVILAPDIYDFAWKRKINYDTYQWLEDIKLLQEHLNKYLLSKSIDKIVATHVLPSLLGVGLKKRGSIKCVYSVITDFGAHSLWPISGIDMYFVAAKEIKNTLIYRGIEEKSIKVTGIPIKQNHAIIDFIKPVGKKIKVLIVAGGVRSGGYYHIQHYIKDIIEGLEKNKNKIDITIVTGSQKELKKKLTNTYKNSTSKPRILGLVHDLPMLMSLNDIIITKPGGLVISEALAVGISLVLLKPGPGQENANAEFLIRNGIALNGETSEQAISSINWLIFNPNMLDEIKLRTKKFGFPNSTQKVAECIIS